MANTQHAGRSNAERHSLSTASLLFLTLPNEAIDPTENDSSAEDNDSESFSSNRAQIDETEVHEDTNDDPTERECDSPTARVQRRDENIPKHAMELYQAGFMNQPCYCAYHFGDVDAEDVGLQGEEESTILKPLDAEYASDAHRPSFRPIRSNLLQSQDCCYYSTLEGDTHSDERSSGQKCEGA